MPAISVYRRGGWKNRPPTTTTGGARGPAPAVPRRRDRAARAWAQDRVFPDQGAVEVAGESLDLARKGGRKAKAQVPCVRNATRSSICGGLSTWPNGGITPFGYPGTTYAFGSAIDSW